MKTLLQSRVLAALILSAGLMTSAIIISRPNAASWPSPPVTAAAQEETLSEETIKAQFISQIKEQVGTGYHEVLNQDRTLKDLVIDRYQMSPKKNHIDIEYHATWQNTDACT